MSSALASGANLFRIGRQRSRIDMTCLAVVVGCCVRASQIGRDHGSSLAGSLIGAGIGGIAAMVIRKAASL